MHHVYDDDNIDFPIGVKRTHTRLDHFHNPYRCTKKGIHTVTTTGVYAAKSDWIHVSSALHLAKHLRDVARGTPNVQKVRDIRICIDECIGGGAYVCWCETVCQYGAGVNGRSSCGQSDGSDAFRIQVCRAAERLAAKATGGRDD